MAAKFDDRTQRGWPLPHKANRLYDDVERLREALKLIDANMTSVEGRETHVEGRQDFLDTRMDAIAGQATEETEVLDARVDSEGNIHPNLGHNIRHIHSGEIDLARDFQGLALQFSALAEAYIKEELNELEAHERLEGNLKSETSQRVEDVAALAGQLEALSEAAVEISLNLHDLNKRRKDELIQEQAARIASDDELRGEHQRGVAELSDALNTEFNSRLEGDALLQTKIEDEIYQRSYETDALSTAIIDALNGIHAALEARRKALQAEIARREASDGRIEILENENTERQRENAELSGALVSETNNRLEGDAVINAKIEAEVSQRSDDAAALMRQDDVNSQAIIQNIFNIHQEAVQRRTLADRLIQEVHNREREIEGLLGEIAAIYKIPLPQLYEKLQAQIDANAEANINNSLEIAQEAAKRREAVNKAVKTLNLEDYTEREIRYLQDDGLQEQLNMLASALLELIINNAQTQRRVREIEITASEEGTNFASDELFNEVLNDALKL